MIILLFVLLVIWFMSASVLLSRKGKELYKNKDRYGHPEDSWYFFGYLSGIIATIIAVASIIIPINTYCSNIGIEARMEAFYNANAQNYATAYQATDNTLSVSLDSYENALVPIDGSIEKTQLGTEVANRIVEWRDSVNAYNNRLYTLRRFDKNLFLGIMYPTPNTELKYIVIK